MSMRTRLIALAVVCLLAIGGAVAYLVHLHGSKARQVANAPTVSVADPAALNRIAAAAHIVFRSTALGADYGKLAMVSLADPGGPRALTGTSCDRVYAAAAKILCLSSEQGVVTTYRAEVLGTDLQGAAQPAAGRHPEPGPAVGGRHAGRHHQLHRRRLLRRHVVLHPHRDQRRSVRTAAYRPTWRTTR